MEWDFCFSQYISFYKTPQKREYIQCPLKSILFHSLYSSYTYPPHLKIPGVFCNVSFYERQSTEYSWAFHALLLKWKSLNNGRK